MCKQNDDRINIEDFVNVFIETEDTINFRIQLDRSKIEEYKAKKQDLRIKRENEFADT